MDLTSLAFCVYLSLTSLLTVVVGAHLYRHGEVYLLEVFQRDTSLVKPVNKILLTGYYLLNLGYATMMITGWEEVTSFSLLISSVSDNIAHICLILAGIHHLNLYTFYLYNKFYVQPNII
jgi:hypothetical protein